MNWHSQTVILYLWCAQPVLQAGVVAILWRRKLRKQFPAFFWFLVAQVINFVVLFPLWQNGNHDRLYFWLFWLGECVNAVLGFKVIHEIFLEVFRPYHMLKDLGTLLFKWAGVVMLMVSVVVAFSNSMDHSPVLHAVSTLQRSVRIVQFGLILFMILFSRYLGISRRQITFGIALGFGVFAGVELMLLALSSGGFVRQSVFNEINQMSQALATLVWVGYALSSNAGRVSAANRLQTDRWEQGLADLRTVVPSDSLIPMFENMVERAFSRSSSLELADEAFVQKDSDTPAILNKANAAKAGSKEIA